MRRSPQRRCMFQESSCMQLQRGRRPSQEGSRVADGNCRGQGPRARQSVRGSAMAVRSRLRVSSDDREPRCNTHQKGQLQGSSPCPAKARVAAESAAEHGVQEGDNPALSRKFVPPGTNARLRLVPKAGRPIRRRYRNQPGKESR